MNLLTKVYIGKSIFAVNDVMELNYCQNLGDA